MLYRRALCPALVRLGGGDPETAHERVLAALAFVSRSAALTRALEIAMSLGQPDTSRSRGRSLACASRIQSGWRRASTRTASRCRPRGARLQLHRGRERSRAWRSLAIRGRASFVSAGMRRSSTAWVSTTRRGEGGGAAQRTRPLPVPLGLSLGKSKVTPLEEAAADYLASLDALYPYGDYFAVNVSSPNTPGLRELQDGDRLDALLAALIQRLRERAPRKNAPRQSHCWSRSRPI